MGEGDGSGGSAPPAGDIKDITNSPAYVFLDELLSEGKIPEAKAALLKNKYAQLHEVVLQMYESEKQLLKKAKGLNQELMTQKTRIEQANSQSYESNAETSTLRRELLKAENEVALRQERDAMLHLEITELQRQRADLTRDVEKIQKMNAELLEPQIQALKKGIAELQEEIEKHRSTIDRLTSEREESTQKTAQLRQTRQELEAEILQDRQVLVSLKSNPEKTKKQADVVQTATHSLDSDAHRLMNQLLQLEAEVSNINRRRKEFEEEGIELALQLEKHRNNIEQKERQGAQILKELELSKDEASNHLADRVKLEMDQKMLVGELRHENESLLRRVRAKDAAMRQLRRADFQLQQTEATLPTARLMRDDTLRELESTKQQHKKQSGELEDLRREVDIFINNFLNQENVEKERSDSLRKIQEIIKLLEKEVGHLGLQEQTLHREIGDLSAVREMKAREAAKATGKLKHVREELKMKELVIEELQKKSQEVSLRLKEFSSLYEIVKNERNKYVNLIQASAQAIAEMKEKIKILQNEIEILRNESLAKDKALTKERLKHQTAYKSRDNWRSDLNRKLFQHRSTQETLDQQIAEIDKLNSIINLTEEDMIKMRKQYEQAVEDRNYTGVQLIDRNDELCILYEKLNIQESITKSGEVEMRAREQEIRVLNLQVGNLEREIAVTLKLLPKIAEFENEIMSLQNQLSYEQARAERLSNDLENPENNSRWRRLEGKDPEPEELAAKIQSLEERLNDKQEQLLEKELIFEEVTNLSNRLRKQAHDGRHDTLSLAKKVNEFQTKIKDVTRKMMATVAELSMYQASAVKLQQEKHDREIELEESVWRFENGQPPTEDAERTWYRMERERLRRLEEAAIMAQAAPGVLADGDDAARTTAEPRPNAYLSDDTGLPQPYGGMAPFKPSDIGANMRHIRKPKIKPIEI